VPRAKCRDRIQRKDEMLLENYALSTFARAHMPVSMGLRAMME